MGRVWIALALVASIGACGRVADSRINPLNWFGGSRVAPAVSVASAEVQDTRPLIAVVQTLDVAPTSAGAIIRATGIASVQGFWQGVLIPVPDATPGALTYAFRAEPPLEQTRVSTPRSREVTVAVELSNRELDGIREIRVTGEQNSRSARR